MTLQSCLYEGRVRHRRFRAPAHAFGQRLFMVYLDLEELPHLFRQRWLWSARRPNVAWFRRTDHFGSAQQPLAESVRDLVADRLGARPRGPIRLLTQLRYFGVQMNPISLYYCFGNEESLEAVVAEVHNTPWGEQHCYVLPASAATGICRAREPKEMHVSPFLGMDLDYEFRISRPGRTLVAHVACHDRQQGASPARVFSATLGLRRRALDGREMARMLCRYPVMTAQVLAGIYWQAFRLWRKGAPFHPHPRRVGAAGAHRPVEMQAPGDSP